jgi:hypothetical protein
VRISREALEIVRRAREILDSPSKWNRADNRVCPETAKTFSLYIKVLQRACFPTRRRRYSDCPYRDRTAPSTPRAAEALAPPGAAR